MAIPTYTPNVPPDGSSLGSTKADIRDNLDGTFQTLGIDHINNNGEPGTNPAGYHNIIHQVLKTSVTAIPNINQVFSGIPGILTYTNGSGTFTSPAIPSGGDTQLYSLTGNGGFSQLTGNFAANNGYVWCAGILIQWGLDNVGSISFTPNFPTNCFVVQATPFGSPLLNPLNWVYGITAKGKTGFTISATGMTKVYWIAIGN